jgi:MFS family permease
MSHDTPIPGTIQLIDAAGNLHVEHGAGDNEIVLVPQPTNDVNDPLRWTKGRKMITMVTALAWCFFVGTMISGLPPAYNLIEEDTGIAIADLSTGNGLMYLMMGWGTMITQRLALSYGRRSTIIVSAIGITAMTLWTAFISSRGEYFANRMLLGTFTSPQETLIEIIVGDLHFTHNRGKYLGLYTWHLFCGAFLSPVATGYIAQALGWRWIQYILTILGVILTIFSFFCFEETMFYRDHTIIISHAQAATIQTVQVDEDNKNMVHDSEKVGPQETHTSYERPSSLPDSDLATGTKGIPRTYAQKLKLWGYRDHRQPNPFKLILLPIQLLLQFPGMFFSGVLVGGILSWYTVVGGSQALIFGRAPYNFSAHAIGLTYLSCLVGVTIGCVLSGNMSDKLAIFLARRHHGIMEPEQRLWICLISLVLHPAGCLLYGVGASFHIHWFGVVFGLGMICVTIPIGSTLAYTYVIDSYRELAGEGLVSIILVRNMMGKSCAYNHHLTLI